MAGDQRIIKQDGYLNIATESCSIAYHQNLNVILVFNGRNEIKVLDVHSGVILQSCTLSGNSVSGRYMPLQDKILFYDGVNVGLRGDYNGVLLLDTIVQAPVGHNDDLIKLELLLSEAVLFQQSLQILEENGLECPTDVSNELLEKIKEAQSNSKKSIKAQRWNTICLELPYLSLKLVANKVVQQLNSIDKHIPALAIASAINERLTDLLIDSRTSNISGNVENFDRTCMYSEAVRRMTFQKWPHMDYKWALPDQMAQAGFYHHPSTAGEDRAMCFTCNVCLVCWEKTDEPWSEHERHSPNCPFVKGEYTQNVPLSVTYATNPAIKTSGFDVISNSDYSNVLCTSSSVTADITVWSLERQLKKVHTFSLASIMSKIAPDGYDSAQVTAICVIPNKSKTSSTNNNNKKENDIDIDSNIIAGVTVTKSNVAQLFLVTIRVQNTDVVLEEHNEKKLICNNKNEADREEDFKISLEELENKYQETEFMSDLLFFLDDTQKGYEMLDPEIKMFMELNKKPEGTKKSVDLQKSVPQEKTGTTWKELLESHKSEGYTYISTVAQKISECQSAQAKASVLPEKPVAVKCSVQSWFEVESSDNYFEIDEIIPTSSACNHILVKLLRCRSSSSDMDEDNLINVKAELQLFAYSEQVPLSKYKTTATFIESKTPKEICVLPAVENAERKVEGVGFEGGAFCIVCADGTLLLLSAKNLELITDIASPSERFVSVAYCKSLDRLCGCTENGSLVFYSLHDANNESGDEMMDEDVAYNTNSDTVMSGVEDDLLDADVLRKNVEGTASSSIASESPTSISLLAHKSNLSLEDLKTLYFLTLFDEMLTPYNAEVPSCWNELVQAQKQRRHPQHLRPGDDTHLIKTWRLHNDATTWDEHLIEINLPKTVPLGHVDFKFSLYQTCTNPPAIQVTLLKQNTSGFGYRMKGPHSVNFGNLQSTVDESIDFTLSGNESAHDNPVLTEEYLQAHNAEILVGPIELSSCMNLCDHGGLVSLTSPKLFKTRSKNFLLHIKTMVDPAKEGQTKTRGCDWLHEISITIRSTKTDSRIPNERAQRVAMLESDIFLETLLRIISNDSPNLERNIALDILIWVCSIRLNRFRAPNMDRMKAKTQSASSMTTSTETMGIDMMNQQIECVAIFEKYLPQVISKSIVINDRSTAHKCVKLILLLSEGVRNLPSEAQANVTFDSALKNAIVQCLPQLPAAKFSSVIRWFTLLVSSTSSAESHHVISQKCVQLLMDVTKEIGKRWDPYCSLLGSRFGLYGFPFEPDLFDIDIPNVTKNNGSIPNTLVNIIRNNNIISQSASSMDLKKLSSIDGVEFRSFPHLIKCKGVSNQVRGLLEVQPLNFTCFSASEATRIDNIDTMPSTSASNINMDENFGAPMQTLSTTEQKKKFSEKHELDALSNMSNFISDIISKQIKKHKPKKEGNEDMKPNGYVEQLIDENVTPVKDFLIFEQLLEDNVTPVKEKPSKYKTLPKIKAICNYIEKVIDNRNDAKDSEGASESKLSNKVIQKYLNDRNNEECSNTFSWHKLLATPPKQMVVIDRIHSGARRFVVLDFGSPILLTDLIIPACDELSSLSIDIWCFEEEADSVRLVVTQDIGTKTLVLSDLQPPPICRYLKISIIGRCGLSATRCKIPIGSFYGHVVVLDEDGYGDPLIPYLKHSTVNVNSQLKALNSLYEDVHCRYSLSSSKLMELLNPLLNCDMSNVAHMQAFIQKNKDDDSSLENNKIVTIYEECIVLQHQLNVIKNVVNRLASIGNVGENPLSENLLETASRDKLRVLGQSLIEILLRFSTEYGMKNIFPLHQYFTIDVANTLFNTLVVSGDAHIQLATCSLLVRMCCFQSWWGDFLADIFCNLFSSQNSRVFPQDRVFFLLTYLGRRSIAMGTCRSIVIDAILKTLAKLMAPISSRYQYGDNNDGSNENSGLWLKSDLQLVTWLLLFLSVCLDDNSERKDKSANRWEFMSCEADFTRSRSQSNSNTGKHLRCFKKRTIHQSKYNMLQPFTDWGKKMCMLQNELPEIIMELTGKPKPRPKPSNLPKPPKDPSPTVDGENSFDKGLKTIKLTKILIVIRGLVTLLLEMDFMCNMDLFLLTCKIIARLVSACRPAIQLSKIITTNQLEQLIRLAVWNDQQQPWAVHAITCLLQDLLDADKNFKDPLDLETSSSEGSIGIMEIGKQYDDTNLFEPTPTSSINMLASSFNMSYADALKYTHLPSLIECEDTEVDEFLSELDMGSREKNLTKKDGVTQNKTSFNYFCKSVSSAMDARLDAGLDTNIEISIRRLTMIVSLDMYASLPQIPINESISASAEIPNWPDYIQNVWTGPEYNSGLKTYRMFKNVFDNILMDLNIQDTWVHLEQVLQMWLTLNSELSDKSYNASSLSSDIPKIPFNASAINGLLQALAWHNDIKLRTWSLGFQCLTLACNPNILDVGNENHVDSPSIAEVIVNDENFERMLIRFFSGYGMSSSSMITNRCAGPTICKYLHELINQMKPDCQDYSARPYKKLKETLLNVILQLVQPGGAISNQQGPIDAQSQLVGDMFNITFDKSDLNVALNIIESTSFLVYNNISNSCKIQCQRSGEPNNSSNMFGSLFATVLGADNTKQSTAVSDNSLLISLLNLSATLVQTELPRRIDDYIIPETEMDDSESQTDETKAEQLINDNNRTKVPCIADAVLRQFSCMKRLLGSLSNSSSNSSSLLAASSICSLKASEMSLLLSDPDTTADAVLSLLILLSEKASHPSLVVAPVYQYLESNSMSRNAMPRLQLSEIFLWYILKIFEVPAAVSIFTEMGGVKILCQNLVKTNKVLVNVQPGLISLIMQHMTKNTKLKLQVQSSSSSSTCKKSSNSSVSKGQENNINFAPFCTISSENSAMQSADVLIQNPTSSHRRARQPAWSYIFYPTESHLDLTITLPTAILLKEIQLQPHLLTLATCPSAVAVEICRDFGLGPIPFGQPLSTEGMTCIRLKLSKPEIATSIVLRLYKPKDSANIGLTQISILGNTIFSASRSLNGNDVYPDDESLAKTSIGWVRILARCFTVSSMMGESKLARKVIGVASEYPGLFESCCALMSIVPFISSTALQNLEIVLLKLGSHNREMCLSLIRNSLWGTSPQTYRISNEAVCDLLFNLCTAKDLFINDKMEVLLDWIVSLQQNYSSRTAKCTNPQSGFVKSIAAILWHVHTESLTQSLPEILTYDVFEACLYWITVLDNDEPLKIAFDSLLCSFCCIKPELFNSLLRKVNVVSQIDEAMETNSSMDDEASSGITDDNKEVSGTEWWNVASKKLSTLLVKPSYFTTLSMACQSPLAIYQLVDSSLPKLLAHALNEFCCSLSPDTKKSESNSNATPSSSSERTGCLTDSDKAENCQSGDNSRTSAIINTDHVPKILDFFAECCAEGHMRDWLGSYQGSIFWKPLLELLCNCRPIKLADESMQQAYICVERSTINFFTRVTACHPKNQDNLTAILISVIKKPQENAPSNLKSKSIISGFTRRIVLQLFLENERILISVRSKIPLQKRDHWSSFVNNHPSMIVNSRHILFYVGVQTKCQDILQQCVSDSRQQEPSTSVNSSRVQIDNKNFEIKLDFNSQGMEFLSVAAGVTAKDKRIKDVKNQAAALRGDHDHRLPSKFSKLFANDEFMSQTNPASILNCVQLVNPDCPDVILSSDTTISQILATLHNKGISLSTPCVHLDLIPAKGHNEEYVSSVIKAGNMEPLPSPLQRFSSKGGLSLLAHYLPTVYPESSKTATTNPEKEKSPSSNEWVKIEHNEDIYEDLEDSVADQPLKHQGITSVPQHSLAAFGLFLRLPAYSDVLLRDKLRAQCLLRLVLGVTGDGEGNDIYSLSLAPSLPTLPFEVFRQLLDNSPLTTDDGMLLRMMTIEVGAMHLVLNCLAIFTHQSQNFQMSGPQVETAPAASGVKSSATNTDTAAVSDDKSHMYWAKGTGFGTGSTQQSWNVEQALLRQKSEEEHVTVLLQVLSSYVNPGDKLPSSVHTDEILNYHELVDVTGELPPLFVSLLERSCLVPALSSYLRNDSVLDITRHIPLYRAILQLLRAISLSHQLVSLLHPKAGENSPSISELLLNMKRCVDTYAKRLKVNKKSNIKGQTQKVVVNIDDGDDEGLALLIPDIQETSFLVQKATNIDSHGNQNKNGEGCSGVSRPLSKSIEQRYLEIMKKLQFDTHEMIVEAKDGYRFTVSHHFESSVRSAGDGYHPSRVKRLAQETVTLSTSLPLSYSSSVFVRCDVDRLDIMKVLITGPADTPYANGCFEFDVYFPSDYPNSPMLINLETTGRHSVRFNPNLYNDGKVCLSVLNTWHGRPEEKWNAQTSSFLQVLVSIQSLILVPEPYFNEPGFERSRGTPSGTNSSIEYNSNIYQACVRWAMLEQIRNPNPCFKEVIHTHFWLKRNEICNQIENWIEELNKPQYNERSGRTISFNSMVLRRQYRQLREELAKLKVPEGLEDLDVEAFSPNVTMTESKPTPSEQVSSAINSSTESTEAPTETTALNTPTSSNFFDPTVVIPNVDWGESLSQPLSSASEPTQMTESNEFSSPSGVITWTMPWGSNFE